MRGIIAFGVWIGLMLTGCGEEPKLEKRRVFYPNKQAVLEEYAITRTKSGDTLLQGVRREYFWDGTTKQSVIWKDGKRHGSAQAWYDGGNVKWQKVFQEGMKTGTWRLYFKGGKPWVVLNYADDKLNGAAQVWNRESGEGPKEATFTNGACASGDCGLLDPAALPEGATPEQTIDFNRQADLLREFLE